MNEDEVINLVDTFKAQGKGLMSRDHTKIEFIEKIEEIN